MYPENPQKTQVIVGSMDMGYDINPTLLGFEFATCSVTRAHRFLCVTATDIVYNLMTLSIQHTGEP